MLSNSVLWQGGIFVPLQLCESVDICTEGPALSFLYQRLAWCLRGVLLTVAVDEHNGFGLRGIPSSLACQLCYPGKPHILPKPLLSQASKGVQDCSRTVKRIAGHVWDSLSSPWE